MDIEINDYEDLLTFIKRKDVTAKAAVNVFEGAFCIVSIIFVDALSREPHLVKEKVIQKIESYINNCKEGRFDKVVLFC